MSAETRARVEAYYRALWSADYDAAMRDHLAADYVEHDYAAGFSRDGLRDLVVRRRDAAPGHGIVVHKVLSEGDLVFVFAEEKMGDGVDVARAELFRLDGDGRIAEHWGAHVEDEKKRLNPNDTFGGSEVDRNVDHARRFRDTFEALDARGFDGQELDTFEISRRDYKQHSPKGGDGIEGLVEILGKAKAAGIKVRMKRFRSLCDGDFLVSHRLYDTDPPHPLMTRIYTFDIFRLDADGKAVEHWDVMDSVPDPGLLEKMI